MPALMKRAYASHSLPFASRRLVATLLAASTLLAGCGTTSSGGALDSALGMVGLQRPQAPDEAVAAAEKLVTRPARVVLRLHAGQTLNANAQNQSLPVVMRIYKLRDKTAFQQAPQAAFADVKASAFPQLAGDIVEVKEVVLTPGQRYEVVETVSPEARYIAAVALFRAADEQRWRFVFDRNASVANGITLGVHGCAISVAAGQALDVPLETTRLAGARCR